MIPHCIEIIQRLLHLLASILNNSNQQNINVRLTRVIVNNRFNENALRDVEAMLSTEGRMDLVQIIEDTMQGNYSLLEEHERFYLPWRDEFHNGNGPDYAAHGWPNICFQFSENNNPVRQESCCTERGAVVAQETQGQLDDVQSENRRHRDDEPPREPDQSSLQQRKPPVPSLVQSRTQSISEPHVPFFTATCCICSENIQPTQNSSRIWFRISDVMKTLSREELLAFLQEINNYDRENLNISCHDAITWHQIVHALRESCNLCGGRHCVLRLVTYAFRSIGRYDLADEIREL